MLAPKTQIFKTGQYTHDTINKKRKEDTMATPKKQKFRTFEIQHRDMFTNVAEYVYDTINDYESIDVLTSVLTAFQTPAKMRESFRSGNAPVLMTSHIEEIERLKETGEPFAICILRGDKVFCLLTDLDISF